MNDSLVVCVGQSFQCTKHNRFGLSQGQTPSIALHQLIDAASFTILDQKVKGTILYTTIEELDYVRVLQLACILNFTQKIMPGHFVYCHFRQHYF